MPVHRDILHATPISAARALAPAVVLTVAAAERSAPSGERSWSAAPPSHWNRWIHECAAAVWDRSLCGAARTDGTQHNYRILQ